MSTNVLLEELSKIYKSKQHPNNPACFLSKSDPDIKQSCSIKDGNNEFDKIIRSISTKNEFRFDKINVNNRTYVIKIDDNYKIVYSSIKQSELLELIHKIYSQSEATVYSLPEKDYTNTLNRLKLKNSFIENEINDPMEFCENIVKSANTDYYFTYFTKLDTSDTIEIKNYDKNESDQKNNSTIFNSYLESNDDVKPYNYKSYSDEGVDAFDLLKSPYKEYTNNSDNSSTNDDTLFPTYKVYFNIMQNNISIFQFSINRLKDIFPEMVEIYSGKLTDEQFSDISELVNEVYVNADDAKLSINKVVNDKVLSTKLSFGELKRLINKYFILDNNIENKIKFTNIWNIITKNFNISEQYIGYYKHQLPLVLEAIGLSKKRYSDGMYWYGLTERNINNNKEAKLDEKSVDNPISEDEYKEKLSTRSVQTNELKEFIKNEKVIDINLKKLFD
jgi:CRISPR/Cas system-associated protein endoribonuclease Cas2